MSEWKKIVVERTPGEAVWRVKLNAPKANVLDAAMVEEMRSVAADIQRARAAKLVVLEGEGEHFSFGASVEEHRREQVAAMLERFHALIVEWLALEVPTLAAVRGYCLGGGLELALACTWIAAEEGAVLGVPEIQLAVFPPPACVLLPRRIAPQHAEDWILSGRKVHAREADRAGLLRALVPEGELDAWIVAFASEHVLPHSSVALRHASRAVRSTWTRDVRAGLDVLRTQYVEELMASHDANEGIAAFLAKRAPRFENR